jgi:hypothetical protein
LVRKNKGSKEKEKEMRFIQKFLSKIIKVSFRFKYLKTENRQGDNYHIYLMVLLVQVLGKDFASIEWETDGYPVNYLVMNVKVIDADLSSNTGLQHHFIRKTTRNA